MFCIILQVGKKKEGGPRTPTSASGLFFKHAGHRFKAPYFYANVVDLLDLGPYPLN